MKGIKALALVLVLAVLLCGCGIFQPKISAVEMSYTSDGTEMREYLNIEEATTLVNLLSGKTYVEEAPDGVFEDSVEITMSGTTFRVAADGSGWIEVVENGYVQLDQEEAAELYDIFENHGVVLSDQ